MNARQFPPGRQASAGLESGLPKPIEQDRRQARPVALARARHFPRIRSGHKGLETDRAAPPHVEGGRGLPSSSSTGSTASREVQTPMASFTHQPCEDPMARKDKPARAHRPEHLCEGRGAAEHCVNHGRPAPTWVSRADRRPSLKDSARATAQQCRHGQVVLHASAAGCALAPQERLEAGIPNVLNKHRCFRAAPTGTADNWPRRGQ